MAEAIAVDAPYAKLEQLEPGIARVLAHNPSAFTYYGTQTYLIGTNEVAVIDPGPDLPEHVEALERRLAAEKSQRSCARTPTATTARRRGRLRSASARRSSGARRWRWRRSARAPMRRSTAIIGRTGSSTDGDALEVDGEAVTAVATPGHTSNHLCFSYRGALFSGDHVMGWSTTVVVPPDGDMAAYMASLDRLRQRDDRVYYPAHGPPVTNPRQYVRHLVGHRMQREKQILGLVTAKALSIAEIVANAYPGLDPRLVPAAGGSVFAHLVDLNGGGWSSVEGDEWIAA